MDMPATAPVPRPVEGAFGGIVLVDEVEVHEVVEDAADVVDEI
jgi:hypothetical protein